MNPRSIALVAAALVIAVGAAFFVRGWLQSQKPEQVVEAPKATAVLVAKVDLPAGTFIKETDMRWQPWPDDTVDPAYLLESKNSITDFVGAVPRQGIAAGEPITGTRVAKPGDRGFLAAVLKPGMRAISIAISETSGISGLVFAGDRVDIILTHAVGTGKDSATVRASETVLENVRVLALDQSLNDQRSEPKVASTATIEVTPKQVEMVAVVQELGRLSLSLRSLAKPEDEAIASIDAEEEALLQELASIDSAVTAPAPDSDDPAAPSSSSLYDIAEPERGLTYTLDNEVSHLINKPRGKDLHKVLVYHGNQATEVTVD